MSDLVHDNTVSMSDIIKQQAQRIQDLEQELRIVKRQLQQFQGRQMDEILERRRAWMQFYREEYEREHMRSTGRILSQNLQNDGDGMDTPDCM